MGRLVNRTAIRRGFAGTTLIGARLITSWIRTTREICRRFHGLERKHNDTTVEMQCSQRNQTPAADVGHLIA